jgi:hypothetical protein
VVVDVVLVLGGGAGSGAGAPVVSMCPARAETASVRLRIIAPHVWRKGFIFVAPRELQNFCNDELGKHGQSGNTLQAPNGLR